MFGKHLKIDMQIVFRTDASVEIGTGHVMRCLTLADALRSKGAECVFLSRLHAGHLFETIIQRGHEVISLSAKKKPITIPANTNEQHALWLGTDWSTDSMETLKALEGKAIDWLVIDHYALDYRWEKSLKPTVSHIMVIDDLADRPHDCDLLLDQNLGRIEQDYKFLLPNHTVKLLGPQYALLRPEFGELRAQSLQRRSETPPFKNLLIMMGGVDKNNLTGDVLAALYDCKLPKESCITVIMGTHAPWLAQIQIQAAQMPWPTRVLVNVDDIAKLMAESDLAIGAGGGAAWERCSLGLPSLVLVLASNQAHVAQSLQKTGAADALFIFENLKKASQKFISKISDKQALLEMVQSAAAVTDGAGSTRVVQKILDYA